MTLEKLLKDIESVNKEILTLKHLIDTFHTVDIPRAGVSYKGSCTVYFSYEEVESLLDKRGVDLQARLKRLMDAKDAAEKTASGWLNHE